MLCNQGGVRGERILPLLGLLERVGLERGNVFVCALGVSLDCAQLLACRAQLRAKRAQLSLRLFALGTQGADLCVRRLRVA